MAGNIGLANTYFNDVTCVMATYNMAPKSAGGLAETSSKLRSKNIQQSLYVAPWALWAVCVVQDRGEIVSEGLSFTNCVVRKVDGTSRLAMMNFCLMNGTNVGWPENGNFLLSPS